MPRAILFSLVLLLTSVTSLHAGEGVLEINQTCAASTGCFSGDGAGFPVTISAPGSYRLTSKRDPGGGPRAILLATAQATVDLNGFLVLCTAAAAPGTHCIGVDGAAASAREGNALRNGLVQGGGEHAVFLGDRSYVEDLRVKFAIDSGIVVGVASQVRDCEAYRNFSGHGIRVGEGSRVVSSVASNNFIDGIFAGNGSTILGNALYWNGSNGISAGLGSTVSGNSASKNSDNGIVGAGLTVAGNNVYNNGLNGIQTGGGFASLVRGNSALLNTGYGLWLGFDSAYRENVVDANTAGSVIGGVNMGGNSCNGTLTCP
jgi:hypothetical protein